MRYEENNTYRGIEWKPRFYAPDLFSPPRPLSKFDDPHQKRKQVCVVGAGLAGLAAAYELSSLGHEVAIFETSDRPGGRVYTHRFVKAGTEIAYGELGAMRIPEDHQLVFDYLKELGLQRRRFISENSRTYMYFEGKQPPYRRSEWEALMADFRLRTQSAEVRHPDTIISAIAEDAKSRLSVEALWGMFSSSLQQPPSGTWQARALEWLSTYESQTLWQHVSLGRYAPLTAQEWEAIGRFTLNLPFERAAFTQWLINNVALQNPNKWEIKGGMSALVDKLVEKILSDGQSRLNRNCTVIEISAVDRGTTGRGVEKKVEVVWKCQLGVHRQDFDYVVCAAPAPATARIRFPQMTSNKYEALTNISYFPSAKALILCDKRHWEFPPDSFAGGATFTDLGTQQSWYPSDNARRVTEGNGGDVPNPPQPESGDPGDIGGTFVAEDKKLSEEPGAFLAAYMYGPTAQHFSSLDKGERFDFVIQNVSQYHPWLKWKGAIQGFESYSWDDQSSPGGGAYAFFSPGEFSRYQRLLEQPLPADEPRIFFAGEHVAVLHAWMQSALQSGVAAARRVTEAR
ncbi:flavin monoamine oxidase family protein [Streptomyces sasae]|uniref:flavin monoamine oxidase family protein n=1 Tax=Streptomyces sasae TaxID=1266772 RepID=UPI00292CC214|nr:NAD(P)/FAD-dependent oxidoreductase [Streptomyces sasae]